MPNDFGLRHLILIVVMIVIGLAMFPLLDTLLSALNLEGGAADLIPYVGVFFVLALVVPIVGFGISRVRGGT